MRQQSKEENTKIICTEVYLYTHHNYNYLKKSVVVVWTFPPPQTFYNYRLLDILGQLTNTFRVGYKTVITNGDVMHKKVLKLEHFVKIIEHLSDL